MEAELRIRMCILLQKLHYITAIRIPTCIHSFSDPTHMNQYNMHQFLQWLFQRDKSQELLIRVKCQENINTLRGKVGNSLDVHQSWSSHLLTLPGSNVTQGHSFSKFLTVRALDCFIASRKILLYLIVILVILMLLSP